MEFRVKKRSNVISTELIAIQDSSFGLTLERILRPMYEDIVNGNITKRSELKKRDENAMLVKAIKDRLGINVKLIISNLSPAASEFVSLNDIGIGQYKSNRGKGLTTKDKKALKALVDTGYVDNDKAVISGSFSKLENKLHLDMLVLYSDVKLSLEEIVAVLLHELGHIFSNLEYSHKLINSSVIMDDLVLALKEDSKGKRAYIHSKLLDLGKKNPDVLADKLVSGDNVVMSTELVKLHSDLTRGFFTEFSSRDKNTERLADNFASRFGYGRSLVTGLAKYNKKLRPNIIFQAFVDIAMGYLLLSSLSRFFIATVMIMTGGVLYISLGLYVGIISYVYLKIINEVYGKAEGISPYDTEKRRYIKIRNDVVNRLKTRNISKGDKKKILESIYSIDQVLEDVKDTSNIPVQFLMKIMSLDMKKYENELKRDDILEELAANNLYIQSAQLSQ